MKSAKALGKLYALYFIDEARIFENEDWLEFVLKIDLWDHPE